ncbi:MAG: hypothetical protein ACLRZ3_15055 [Flavonifractor plautii]
MTPGRRPGLDAAEALTAYLSHEVTGQPGESMAAYWARTRG